MKSVWQARQLGDLVDFVGGGTPRRDNPAYWGGEIPWASVKDITSHELRQTAETITEVGLENSASSLIKAGTVILASRVGLGKVCINHSSVAINQDLKGLVLKSDEILPKFLLYFLISQAEAIGRSGVGATVMGVTIPQLQRIRLALPALGEQHRIVTLLDEADELRRRRGQADRRTASLVPAIFYEMFGEPLKGQQRWDYKTLGDVLSAIDSGWSPSCPDRVAAPDEWGVLKLGAVTSCRYLQNENKALPDDAEPRPDLEVKAGDILFTRKNTHELVAACALVATTRPRLMLSDLIFRLRISGDAEVIPEYLWALMVSEVMRRRVQRLASGSAGSMPNISKQRLRGVSIPVPPLLLQRQFAARVAEIRALEARQAESRCRLDDLFQSMLHRAFQGEL